MKNTIEEQHPCLEHQAEEIFKLIDRSQEDTLFSKKLMTDLTVISSEEEKTTTISVTLSNTTNAMIKYL